MNPRARGGRTEGAGDMRDKELKLEVVKTSHILGGAGEGGVRGEESVEEARGSSVFAVRVTGNIRTTILTESIHGAGAPCLGRQLTLYIGLQDKKGVLHVLSQI